MFVKTEERPQGEVTLQPWQRVMLEAATIIEREGHWKGTQSGSGYCAVTALIAAADKIDDHYWAAACAFSKHMGFADRSNSIYRWNDAEGRTGAEVVAKLRTVALAG